jgi:hypothetical protein
MFNILILFIIVTEFSFLQTGPPTHQVSCLMGRLRFRCDVTRAETRFYLSTKRTSPFKSAGASVQWTAGNRGLRISGNNAGYTMFRGSVKSTAYPLHSTVSPSLPLPCVTVCHHVSTGLYQELFPRESFGTVVKLPHITLSRISGTETQLPHTFLVRKQQQRGRFCESGCINCTV